MEEEKFIEERVGKRNPFLVPDDYFVDFADQMMASLPERRHKAKSVWLRPVFYAAASICALLVCAGVWHALPGDSMQPVAQITAQQELGDEPFDEAADYMMLDNHDIYAYLADN